MVVTMVRKLDTGDANYYVIAKDLDIKMAWSANLASADLDVAQTTGGMLRGTFTTADPVQYPLVVSASGSMAMVSQLAAAAALLTVSLF